MRLWGRRDPSPAPEPTPAPAPVRVVPIREETIRLGQFLKLADLVDSGSDAKPLVQGGGVRVNGETETRRGRQLVPGDEVSLVEAAPDDAHRAGVVRVGAPGERAEDGLPW